MALFPTYNVSPSPSAWREAIRLLLRPSQVDGLAVEAELLVARGYGPAEAVGIVLSGLAYRPDPKTMDLWMTPATTVAKGGGDCEDLALLGASVLIGLGSTADVVIGDLWTGARWGRHAWVEGEDNHGPFLLEATNGDVSRRFRPRGYRVVTREGTFAGPLSLELA